MTRWNLAGLSLLASLVVASCQMENSSEGSQAGGDASVDSDKADSQEDESKKQKAQSKPPELSEEDKKKTRVHFSFGGTGSPCGPNNELRVFEDGVVHCKGKDYVDDPEEDCRPAWGGIVSIPAQRASDWIDFVRTRIKGKALGTDDCEGAWTVFHLYSQGELEARTKNLSCREDGELGNELKSAALRIWHEVCLPLNPGFGGLKSNS